MDRQINTSIAILLVSLFSVVILTVVLHYGTKAVTDSVMAETVLPMNK